MDEKPNLTPEAAAKTQRLLRRPPDHNQPTKQALAFLLFASLAYAGYGLKWSFTAKGNPYNDVPDAWLGMTDLNDDGVKDRWLIGLHPSADTATFFSDGVTSQVLWVIPNPPEFGRRQAPAGRDFCAAPFGPGPDALLAILFGGTDTAGSRLDELRFYRCRDHTPVSEPIIFDVQDLIAPYYHFGVCPDLDGDGCPELMDFRYYTPLGDSGDGTGLCRIYGWRRSDDSFPRSKPPRDFGTNLKRLP